MPVIVDELKRAPDGEVVLLHPAGEVGEDGERLRLLSDDDSESIGLKHCASGLKLLLTA